MSAEKSKKFSEVRKCESCGNRAPMEQVAGYDGRVGETDGHGQLMYVEGYVYEMLLCPSCTSMIVRRYYYHDHLDNEEMDYEVLCPAERSIPDGMPEAIRRAYEAATKVRAIDANAYGVLVGRLLELVCRDRKAEGDTLHKQLQSLASRGEIPEKLVAVANGLRKLRNVGAHAALGELSEEDAPLLDDLARAILDYVYSAPNLVARAEERLARLTHTGNAATDRSDGD